ncbi:uncharacterized protein V2V93DRAFT_367274 [Kockiozyma suomiensis]|uniref:uncharacterized protein n=1 Tax=Kockiozyma suomiensis TaxID=1337062 RepID=UPI0033436EE7
MLALWHPLRRPDSASTGSPAQIVFSCAFFTLVVLLLLSGQTLHTSGVQALSTPLDDPSSPLSASFSIFTDPVQIEDVSFRRRGSWHSERGQVLFKRPSAVPDGSTSDISSTSHVSRISNLRRSTSSKASGTSIDALVEESYSPDAVNTDVGAATSGSNSSPHDRPPICDLLIDPPLFSPPDTRTQPRFVALVVGIITIVTASLMM